MDLEKTEYGPSRMKWMLFGAALGAAAGLLLAPAKGDETRGRISRWIDEKRRKGRETLETGKHRIEEAIHAGRKAYRERELSRT